MAHIFQRFDQIQGVYDFANRLTFAERTIYWGTGWAVFNDYPLLGVGLGNAGFFFPDKMPAFGAGLEELNRVFYYQSFIPNTKNLWVRILAETGLVGFSFFITWLYTLWQTARFNQRKPAQMTQTLGLMGVFALLGLFFEGFSVDSFALPYIWFGLGLVTAGGRLAKSRE